jgi:hypothetical protein
MDDPTQSLSMRPRCLKTISSYGKEQCRGWAGVRSRRRTTYLQNLRHRFDSGRRLRLSPPAASTRLPRVLAGAVKSRVSSLRTARTVAGAKATPPSLRLGWVLVIAALLGNSAPKGNLADICTAW